MGVGMHQGSVLSLLLFILVLEALLRDFCTGVLGALILYANNLLIIVDSLEEVISKHKNYRSQALSTKASMLTRRRPTSWYLVLALICSDSLNSCVLCVIQE